MYRFAVIIAAALSAVGCGFAIHFQIMALAKYRADDLFTATSITNFAVEKGTCVEVITENQLSAGISSSGCDGGGVDPNIRGSLANLRNTLAVSVHGLYYAYRTAGLSLNDQLKHVAQSVISSTINPTGDTIGAGVNYTAAKGALEQVAESSVPTTCDVIYRLTWSDLAADATAYAHYQTLIAGKKDVDDDDDTRGTWPLAEIAVDCDGATAQTQPFNQVDLETLEESEGKAHKVRLYAHCLAQFQFAASGTDPWAGTFGIPLVGVEPGPSSFAWYPMVEGFNRSHYIDYNTKVRMYLGMRYGYSVWAYIPMLIASCYLCADSVVFFLAEATLPDVLAEVHTISQSRLSMVRDSLVMAATSQTSRRKRFAIALTAVVVSFLFWLLFLGLPWGFIYTTMGRPECEAGAPKHVNTWGYMGTTGGWKTDWDATYYELAILGIQILVLLIEGIVTNPLCSLCNNLGGVGEKSNGRAIDSGIIEEAKLVQNATKIRRLYRFFIYPLIIGGIVMILGQAISGARFGMAWAEGIVGQKMHTDKEGNTQPAFNPVLLSEMVYDQTIATMAITIVVGLVIGAALQRHLINGVGCFSATLFFAWLVLVVVFALPLLIYANLRSIFNQDKANEDCAAFPSSGYDFSKGACEARWWTFATGGIILFATLLVMTAFGLAEASASILKVRNKALVKLKQLRGFHPAFREGPESRVSSVLGGPDAIETQRLLGGFKSTDENFFNFKTSLDTQSTDAILYAPRMQLSSVIARS
jgi:hypothetical protein